MSKKNKTQNRKGQGTQATKKTPLSDKPVLLFLLKASIVIIMFLCIVLYIETKGYYNPDNSNNHTKQKWDAFYEFTEKQNVDILLMGNSHLYSGINPKNLSTALGVNAFILASPGTFISDSYFALKEALKRTDARLVVIETYGIASFNPYELEAGHLSDQFKSFYARKDFVTKLTSMPFLFSSDNYFYAWSNTLRNHDFIFNDTTQLAINKKLIKKKPTTNKKLYLGRFVRFQTGIEQQNLDKYDALGAPVKGEEYSYSAYAEKYVKKIVDLCKQKNVELIFLTLPMYEKHISNYEKWEKTLSELINVHSGKWINLQKEPGYIGFGPYAFENTLNSNQHMTYSGSLLATYKLADYIRDSLKIKLPDRSKENEWHKLFYADEGYFENYNPLQNDKNNRIICSNKTLENITLKNCLLLDINNKKANRIIAKIDASLLKGINFQNVQLRILFKLEYNGKETVAPIDLSYDMFHKPDEEVIFTTYIKPLKVIEVVNGVLMKR